MKISVALMTGAVLVAGLLSIPTSAAAMTGREAVNVCNARPLCTFTVDSGGGIYIRHGGRWIYCGGLDGVCVVVVRQVPPDRRPTTVRGQLVESILGVKRKTLPRVEAPATR